MSAGVDAASIAPRFKLIAFNELRPETKPAYLVKGLLPRVGLVLVWGEPKCGKSFWATDVLLHVALGWDYRGRRVQQGPVVYCAFEGADGYKVRAEAFRQRFLADEAGLIPFYLVAAKMEFLADHAELIASVRAQIGDRAPVAVALDTLNRSLGGKEDDERIGGYIRAADAVREAFNCAVLIVHHCGVDASRPRGHTSLPGAADAQLSVKRDSARNIVVTVEFMKDGPEGETVTSRLEQVEVGTDSDGDAITSCVIVPIEAGDPAPTRQARLTKAAAVALCALTEAIDECGVPPPASSPVPATARVVTLEQWRGYAYKRGVSLSEGERARQIALQRATKALTEGGQIGAWGEFVWATGSGTEQ
jgi:hypothetical protein